MSEIDQAIDPKRYREVLGQYPTGVCVIAAMIDDSPIGMVVGSFSSASLDPPLVAFFPDRRSSTWATLSQATRFCVNILSAEQEQICRKLASKEPDKYASLSFHLSPNGSPVLDGVVAWIDCDRYSVTEAGDHFLVLGLVRGLEIAEGGLPLLFFQGGYGGFAPLSLVASDTHGLVTEQLRMVDLARPEMERVAAESGGQCVVTTRLGDELVVAGSAGLPTNHTPSIPVGSRLPFAPPVGSTFAAWLPDAEIERWIGNGAEPTQRDGYRRALARVRERGFAIGELQGDWLDEFTAANSGPEGEADSAESSFAFDPSEMAEELSSRVRMIAAPIFDAGGAVALSLTLQGFCAPGNTAEARRLVTMLLERARRISDRLGGNRHRSIRQDLEGGTPSTSD